MVDHLKTQASNSQYHPPTRSKLTTAIQQPSVCIGVLVMTEINKLWQSLPNVVWKATRQGKQPLNAIWKAGMVSPRPACLYWKGWAVRFSRS